MVKAAKTCMVDTMTSHTLGNTALGNNKTLCNTADGHTSYDVEVWLGAKDFSWATYLQPQAGLHTEKTSGICENQHDLSTR